MKPDNGTSAPAPVGAQAPTGGSSGLRLVLVVILLIGAAAVAIKLGFPGGSAQNPTPAGTNRGTAAHLATESASTNTAAQPAGSEMSVAPPPQLPPGTSSPVALATNSLPPTPESLDLVTKLFNAEQFAAGLTPESAAAWREALAKLTKLGPSAVPAIRELLAKGTDLNFGLQGGQLTGYASGRAAMFDALAAIGGPEAQAALRDTLRSTADPREIAQVARNLETMDPSQTQQEAVQAALQALQLAAKGDLKDKDVGPLFEVLQRYGGAAIAPELEKASAQWNYYSAMALANLPDGSGIPTLAKMADQQKGMAPLQLLAQLSGQYPDARTALLDLVKNDKITSVAWPYLEPVLAGDRFHMVDSVLDPSVASVDMKDIKTSRIVYGNQNFYKAPDTASITADYINQQIAVIDQLMAATKDASAAQYLQQAKATLSARATTPPPATPPPDQPPGN
jgi:hypothetical protein